MPQRRTSVWTFVALGVLAILTLIAIDLARPGRSLVRDFFRPPTSGSPAVDRLAEPIRAIEQSRPVRPTR